MGFPKDENPPYDFAQWDLAQYRRAGEMLTRITQKQNGDSMKSMLLALYFQGETDDNPGTI